MNDPTSSSATFAAGQRTGSPRLPARLIGPLALAIAIIVPLLLFAISAVQQWQAVRTETLERLEHSRDLLRAHTVRVLQTQQQLATAVQERILPMSDADIAGSASLHAYLQSLRSQFPEVRAISVFGAAGQALASSLGFPAPPANIAEQPFFAEMRDGQAPYAISMPYPRGAGRETLFSIGVPVRNPQGVFAGAVVLDIDPDYFQRIYAEVPGGVFELVRSDGVLLLHLPEDASTPASLPPNAFLMQQIGRNEQGTAEGPARSGDRTSLLSYSRLGSFPVYISYEIGTDEIRRLWFERISQQALYFLPATLILAGAAWIAARSQRRLAEANLELARLNASLETSIAEHTAGLTRALAEKDVLIEEVHHRVKNNMQVISSLVGLQTRMGDSAEQTTRRIHAMALVHELIYGSGALEGLDLGHFIQRLCENLKPLTPRGVKLDLDLEPVRIPLEKAVPVALVLNETLTNILQRGFEPDETGQIRVQKRREGDLVVIEITHTGSHAEATQKTEGLAGRLIEGLVAQVQGTMTRSMVSGRPLVRITFPIARLQRAA